MEATKLRLVVCSLPKYNNISDHEYVKYDKVIKKSLSWRAQGVDLIGPVLGM